MNKCPIWEAGTAGRILAYYIANLVPRNLSEMMDKGVYLREQIL